MKYVIQIPKPCHESWEEMTPAEAGRHCASCCKTVVDFTNWQEEDILHYLQQHTAGSTCGRFRSEQLNVPVSADQFITSVTYAPLPYYKKIAAIFLFAFGLLQMSCDTHPAGTPVVKTQDTVALDTSNKEWHRVGLIAPIIKDSVKPSGNPQPANHTLGKPKTPKAKKPAPEYLKGDVAIEEIIPPPRQMMGGAMAYPIEETNAADTTNKKR